MPWYEYTDVGGRRLPVVTVRLRRGHLEQVVPAQIDSGASQSVFSVALARDLGLDPSAADAVGASTADGSRASMLRWPDAQVTVEFAGHAAPFTGLFVDPVEGGDFMNLLGREDFFSRLIVQFWDDHGVFNVDASPDWPQDPLRWMG